MTNEKAHHATSLMKTWTLIGVVAVPVAVWLLLNALWPATGFLWWSLFLMLSGVGIAAFQYTAMALVMLSVAQEPEDLDDSQAVQEITLTISSHSDTPIGKFKDHDFYEWLDLTDEHGTCNRMFFWGTANINEPVTIPPKCVLLPPGLIYSADAK